MRGWLNVWRAAAVSVRRVLCYGVDTGGGDTLKEIWQSLQKNHCVQNIIYLYEYDEPCLSSGQYILREYIWRLRLISCVHNTKIAYIILTFDREKSIMWSNICAMWNLYVYL